MIGSQISHYKIIEKIGGGGMGVVYKAEDTNLNRVVALKFLPDDLTRDPYAKARFIHEARAASALDHPNICNIHDIEETDDGKLFISMAHYEGETLKDRLKRGPLKLDEAIFIIYHVGQGLLKAHEKGIIHRDIKPSNIMLTMDGEVKIVDFGLAKVEDSTLLTRFGSPMGTIAYMSPEQARGEQVDKRTDIWSLGVLLYEMLSGERPFKGTAEQAVIYSILNEAPEKPANIDDEMWPILRKMLDKNPQSRFSDVNALFNSLKKYSDAKNLGIEIKAPALKKKYPLILSATAAALLVIIAVLWFPINPGGFLDKPRLAILPFDNLTGQDEYAYLTQTLPQLLTSTLISDSRYKIIYMEQFNDIIEEFGLSDPEGKINQQLLSSCSEAGIDFVVTGNIVKTGDYFAITASMIETRDGSVVTSAASKGEGINSILSRQIDDLTAGLLADQVSGIIKRSTLITTTNMEAYRWFLAGRERYENSAFEDARYPLQEAVALDSNFTLAYYYLERVYAAMGYREIAVKMRRQLESQLDEEPEQIRDFIRAEYEWYRQRDFQETTEKLAHLENKYPEETRLLMTLVKSYRRTREYEKQLRILEKILKLDPNYASAIAEMGYVNINLGNWEEARRYFQIHLDRFPKEANSYDCFGEFFWYYGKPDSAVPWFEKALEIKPDFPSSIRLVYIHMFLEQYDRALEWLDFYELNIPGQVRRGWAHWWRSFIYFWRGEIERARTELSLNKEYLQKRDLSREDLHVLWLHGVIELAAGNPNLGRDLYNRMLAGMNRWSPRSASYYRVILAGPFGLMHLAKGNIDSARQEFERLEQLYQKNDYLYHDRFNSIRPTEYEMFMNCYTMLGGELMLALDSLDRAIWFGDRIDNWRFNHLIFSPNNFDDHIIPVPRDFSARAWLLKEDTTRAINAYTKLLHPDLRKRSRHLIHPVYHFRLARLYEKMGVDEKAINEYNKYLRICGSADAVVKEAGIAKESMEKLKRNRE